MKRLSNDPFKDVLDTFFETPLGLRGNSSKTTKDDEKYTFYLAVPGLTKDDLIISVKNEYLHISYKKEIDNRPVSFVDSFKRTYSLPEDVDENNIKGKVEDGVLKIELPISKKKPLERLISLN
jgi:HSP20 family protein